MSDSTVGWLKIMENGALGEARARAFLMKRFWVLERSVDIEGADFLIQRRLTGANFLDKDPPRLGVVQVKFIQDGSTTINVRKSYLAGAHSLPYNEFFLLIFTGREDDQRVFLLQAREVLDLFNEVVVKDIATMRLGGAALFAATNYEVCQRARALDKIEHALKSADFLTNRRFLGSMSYVTISPEQIDHDLTLPLDISVDIPSAFFHLKKRARSVLYEIEEVVEALQKILAATDPLEARRIYDAEIREHIAGGYRGNIQFSTDFLDVDLFAEVEHHKARLSKLADLGLTTAYFSLVDSFDRQAFPRLLSLGAGGPMLSAEISITYDPDTLSNPNVTVKASTDKEPNWRTLSNKRGAQSILVGMPHGLFDTRTDAEREKLLKERWWAVRRGFQEAFEVEYLGEELVRG